MLQLSAIQKSVFITLLGLSVLTACQKQEEPATTTPQQTQTHHHDDNHDHDDHDDDHDHAAHDHHHDHTHEHGDTYACDNGKSVQIDTHDHEGEVVAHAIIDDIEYDLPQDSQNDDRYLSPEGLNNEGMVLTLENDVAKFTSLDGKTTHLSCQKQG